MEDSKLVELKLCPFCGWEAKIIKGTDYSGEVEKPIWWMAVCTNPNCIIYDGYGRYANSKEKAKEMWNIRAN